jgi:hypothetical protein
MWYEIIMTLKIFTLVDCFNISNIYIYIIYIYYYIHNELKAKGGFGIMNISYNAQTYFSQQYQLDFDIV